MASQQFEYPDFFEEILKSKIPVRSGIDSALHAVTDILSVSKLPFFPDYTDHGIRHLNSVLEIGNKLISPTARAIFTAEDAGVLIFSILLHDLALHLSEAGFTSLINSKSTGTKWAYRWEEFFNEAQHWDDHTLVLLFGEDSTGAPSALVKDPFNHYDNLTEADRKLIGEFIRRNHPELARQFAHFGFPATNGETIELGTLDKELKRLAGIIAWSHGSSLRSSIECLAKSQFSKLEFDHVHPVFLMGLLRIADFLELGTDRAPKIVFRYTNLKSPISRREWRTNQAFRDISWGNPDPESISIPARPTDVSSFLELERWLKAIQSELDTTWAVFGELFGSHSSFSKLGLTIRRVRSNVLDDPKEFRQTAAFVPRRVALDVAGPQILKLFVEPLYGNHPEIGIRELVQNAVDAVRERREFEKKHKIMAALEVQSGDVEVWLGDPDEQGVSLLSVRDNGIGMTEDTVIDYFLKVGASFRRSVAWKTEFESKPSESGSKVKARVLRSGRFGIGVLSAFLLGDEIEVTTRHVTSDRGLRFSMRLDLSPPAFEIAPIQLDYVDNLPIGTALTVRVTRVPKPKDQEGTALPFTIFSAASMWDWYCLADPRVVRLQGQNREIIKQTYVVPQENSELPPNWYQVPSTDYRTVHVLVHGAHKTYSPPLVCNGFKIASTESGFGSIFTNNGASLKRLDQIFGREGLLRVTSPNFSVFDPDGNLPLNLQRTGLTNLDLDFVAGAFDAQAKANLAQLLIHAPTEPKLSRDFVGMLRALFDFNEIYPIFLTKKGIALFTPTNLRLFSIKNCLLLNAEVFAEGWLNSMYSKYDALLISQWGQHHTSPQYALNQLSTWISSARIVTRSKDEPVLARPLRFRYKVLSENGVNVYRSANSCPSLFDFNDLKPVMDEFPKRDNGEAFASEKDFIAAELFLKDEPPFKQPAQFSIGRLWEQIIREPVIPFDTAERREKLAHAYAVLQAFLPSSDHADAG